MKRPAAYISSSERARETWRERTVRAKFRFCTSTFFAWHLLPTIRFGIYTSRQGFFVAITFLKWDLCVSTDWSKQ